MVEPAEQASLCLAAESLAYADRVVGAALQGPHEIWRAGLLVMKLKGFPQELRGISLLAHLPSGPSGTILRK